MCIYIYIYPLPLEPDSHLPPHPTPLGCHRAPDLSSLHHTANFHWLSNFTYGNIYVSLLLSQFVPPSPVSTSLFFLSVFPIAALKIGLIRYFIPSPTQVSITHWIRNKPWLNLVQSNTPWDFSWTYEKKKLSFTNSSSCEFWGLWESYKLRVFWEYLHCYIMHSIKYKWEKAMASHSSTLA